MAEREFRLPGSTYEDLVNIIVAYGTRDEAAGAGDVGKLDSIHQSSVSRNNAFLTEIGVLQGESKKQVTRRGRSLAVALARKDRAEIRGNWRAIAAACAPPVTTKVSSGVVSGASRASVAWSSVRSSPVSACRNFG